MPKGGNKIFYIKRNETMTFFYVSLLMRQKDMTVEKDLSMALRNIMQFAMTFI